MEGASRKKRRIVEEASETMDDFDTSHETSCGIIRSVTVKNFMCHEHLIAEFKPNINLVQGRNGSGKSAILTAVVVALGGSTRSTNRGSSLKELIKYDKNTATVQVLITNNGKDAYRNDIYGNTITIERKINSGGGGGYKIKSSDGRVVTSKKEDLKRLCDYFNLNVGNPLTVLNQDMSRSFLNSSEPQKLYKFFLQATQLQQMCDYYSQLSDCLKISTNLIEDRRTCLPILEQEVQELSNRYEFCIKQTDKRKKLKDLRRELVWAKITQLEERSDSAKKHLDQCQRIILKFEEKQAQLKTEVDRAKEEYKNVEHQYFGISEKMKDQGRSYRLQNDAQSKSKEKWKEVQRQVEKSRRQVEIYDKEISALKEAVKRDHTTAQQVWEEEHRLHQEQIQSTESQIDELNQVMKTEETHLNNIQNTIKLNQDNNQQLQFEDKNKRRNMQELEQELRTLQSQQTNSFTVFGQWVQSLLDKIENAFKQGRFSAKPIGPLGAYVEMRESQWAHIAEMVIGGRISAFCVNNSQDEKVLRSLFQGMNFGSQQPMIICCKFRKRHDASLISRYEVQSDTYPSLWSVLEISHDVVANYIIDRCQVETVMLIPTAADAGELLKNYATVPHNCKMAYTLNGDKYFPDPNYKVYSGSGLRRARYLQVSAGERAQGVAIDIRRVKEELDNVQEERRKVEAELNGLKRQARESQVKLQKEKSKFKGLREHLMQLQSQEEPPPPNVSQLEEDITKQETKQSAAMETLNVAEEQLKVMFEDYQKTQTELNISKQKLATISKTAHEFEEKMRENEEKANKLMHSDDVLKQTLKVHDKKKKELEIKTNEAENNLQKEKEMANTSFLPRIETERSPDEIERKYKNFEAKLNKEQEQRGDPIQIGEKYKEMKEKYRKMTAELDANTNLIKKLKDSLQERHMQCTHFRKVLSIMIKTNFMESLQVRKMAGKILFDFEKEMLHISVMKKSKDSDVDVVNTSTNDRKKASQQKLAMMSGGERSFATVSFILALWEVMESPVRILDEFDVFMDIIARRQSLDMMIQAAKPKTQYIYLTPLEVNKNHYSSKLNVFRMPDPERGDTQDTAQ